MRKFEKNKIYFVVDTLDMKLMAMGIKDLDEADKLYGTYFYTNEPYLKTRLNPTSFPERGSDLILSIFASHPLDFMCEMEFIGDNYDITAKDVLIEEFKRIEEPIATSIECHVIYKLTVSSTVDKKIIEINGFKFILDKHTNQLTNENDFLSLQSPYRIPNFDIPKSIFEKNESLIEEDKLKKNKKGDNHEKIHTDISRQNEIL